MEVQYQATPSCKFVVDAPGVKEAFQFLSYADSVFGHRRCGNCESPNLEYQYRQPKGFDYYSIKCRDCGHEFKFGITNDNRKQLFPKGWSEPFQGDGEGKSGKPARAEDADDEPDTNGGIPW